MLVAERLLQEIRAAEALAWEEAQCIAVEALIFSGTCAVSLLRTQGEFTVDTLSLRSSVIVMSIQSPKHDKLSLLYMSDRIVTVPVVTLVKNPVLWREHASRDVNLFIFVCLTARI